MKKGRLSTLGKAMILATMLMLPFQSIDAAAKDTKLPSLSAKIASEEPSIDKNVINVYVKDDSGIAIVKWASGTRNATYFNTKGNTVKLNSKNRGTINVSKNGTYSIYVKDKAGNVRIRSVTITNIDKIVPVVAIKKSTAEATNKDVMLSVTIKDEGLGIKSVHYLYGKKYIKDFTKESAELAFTETKATDKAYDNTYYYSTKLNVRSNNTVTFLVEDMAGNKTIRRSYVTNIDKTVPVVNRRYSQLTPTNGSVKVTITPVDMESGVKEVRILDGSKVAKDFVNGAGTILKLNSKKQTSYTVDKNGTKTVAVIDQAGNIATRAIKVSIIDKDAPKSNISYKVMNQKATVTTVASDKSGIESIIYLKGKVTDAKDERWTERGKEVREDNTFTASSSGNYSVLVTDKAGNQTVSNIKIELELRAVWISYLEFSNYGRNGFTKELFEKTIDTMFDNVVDLNMNSVVVQVRPFGDAMYESSYFPWSRYISGTQGVDPGFDPLEYMVEAAHSRDLTFHAWLNPYRVTTSSTDYSKLAKDNPARKWHEDKDESNDRNVLAFDGSLYYNPAVKEVQNLIIKGIREIVNNYDVDGIHFDDYFYPVLGNKYENNFDAAEYKAYASVASAKGNDPMAIGDWRRNNVNTLIKNIYKDIKGIDEQVEFGISPGGFIDYLSSNQGYYVDYEEWLSSSEYIDYITPQIYWSFENKTFPYDKTLDRWLAARTSDTVKMYVGIANYKAGSNLEDEWKDADILKRQIEYGRNTGLVDGYMFFRYDFFYNSVTKKQVAELLPTLADTY